MIRDKINGFDNEYKFAFAINNKKIKELNIYLQDLINELYDYPSMNSVVKCYVDTSRKKYDVVITLKKKTKRISIKKGFKNSVHVESISSFIHFLIQNHVDKEIITEYLKYHYADGTTNGKGENRISAREYKQNNQNKIDLINEKINTRKIMEKVIDRFIVKGNYSSTPIDALIYGTVDDFIWIKTSEIKEIMFNKLYKYSTGVHFGPLTVQPLDRCLNKNPKYEKARYCVQIKWYNIFDDIIEYKNEQVMTYVEIPDVFFQTK